MSLLKEYYDSIAAENTAKTAQDYAGAQLTVQQAQQVGPNAQSTRDLQAAQAQQAGTGAQLAGANAQQVAPNAAASRTLDLSRAGQNDVNSQVASAGLPSEIALRGAQTRLIDQNLLAGTYNLPGYVDPKQRQGFEKGGKVGKKQSATAVPGKGKPGPNDTVPVMLAPGEGILNKGAVEHYGMPTIDRMNAMGLKRMGAQSEVANHLGLPDPHAAPGKPASDRGKKAAAPSKKGGLPASRAA